MSSYSAAAARNALTTGSVPVSAGRTGGGEAARGTPSGHSAAPSRTVSPRVGRLVEALAECAGDETAHRAELDRFWTEVRDATTPLVERIPGEPDHRAVTFLWRGDPETRHVLLLTNRLIDRTDYTSGLMEHLPGTDVWHFTYRLRDDHRGSYRIAPVREHGPGDGGADAGGSLHERLRALASGAVRDPFNPSTIPTRWQNAPSSVFALPEAPPQPWAGRRDGIERGTVEKHTVTSRALGAERGVWVYLPPGPWAGELDTLVLLDGDMWFGELRVRDLLDGMHADEAVRPLAVIAPDAVDNPTRTREFGGRQTYADFLTRDLLTWARTRWPLSRERARTTVAGQSLGGLTALYVGLAQRDDRIGNVISQSPSLWWHPGSRPGIPAHVDEDDAWLTREFTTGPVRAGLRLRLEAGVHEGAMAAMTRTLHQRLRERGYAVTHREFNGGHDYACWSGALADGLAALHAP